MKETKRVNITINIEDIPFPMGVGDEIDIIEFTRAGIIKEVEFLD